MRRGGQTEKDHIHLTHPSQGIFQRNQRIIPIHRVEIAEDAACAALAGQPAYLQLGVAVALPRHTFSRSYGINLPSSFS